MRREVQRKVTVELSEKEVQAVILGMARCPARFRDSATFTLKKGTYVVRLVESNSTNSDKTQPDANPKISEARRRRDKIEMVGRVFGKWEVLASCDNRVFPGGGTQTMWLCRCGGCGTEVEVNGGALRAGTTHACRDCANSRVPDELRRCRFCKVKLSPKSKLPTCCPRCSRQIERMKGSHTPDGLCPCGKFPFYQSKDCPKCDRKKTKRTRKKANP